MFELSDLKVGQKLQRLDKGSYESYHFAENSVWELKSLDNVGSATLESKGILCNDYPMAGNINKWRIMTMCPECDKEEIAEGDFLCQGCRDIIPATSRMVGSQYGNSMIIHVTSTSTMLKFSNDSGEELFTLAAEDMSRSAINALKRLLI